jgi:hypothetical protein
MSTLSDDELDKILWEKDMSACTDRYPHDAHIGECEYCLCIKPVPVAWTQSVLPSPTPCAFDQLPEADREIVLSHIMKTVTMFATEENFLLSQLTNLNIRAKVSNEYSSSVYYEKRMAESRRMAVAWRAAVEKLQTK